MATAWFHVVSYLSSDEQLKKCLKNVNRHLKEGAYFIFDSWYGPAVLWQKPELRVKRFENEKTCITRIAEPEVDFINNCVNVNYDIYVKDILTNNIVEINECHRMRYFFINEIKALALETGYILEDEFEFFSNKQLSEQTWGSCFVLRKTDIVERSV